MSNLEAISPIRQAVANVGGQSAVARAMEIRQSAVHKWIQENRVPAERVLRLEELSGVSRHDLRPDIYPRDSVA